MPDLLECRRGRGCANTVRPLTHSLDYGKEGLGMNPTRTCSVEGCDGRHYARGYCKNHYRMFRTTGDPCGSTARTEPERFWCKVSVRGPDECWVWNAGKDQNGYGIFKTPESTRAHQWSYRNLVGPVPDGYVLDHLCRTQGCVNPAHLEPVTNQENLERGWGRRLRNGMSNKCKNGHEYTPENTYVHPESSRMSGQKVCRTCSRESRARYKEKKAA